MRREKTGRGRKERKEGAKCAVGRERQLSTCWMDVAKWERGTERNGEKYWMKMEWRWDGRRDMEGEGKDRERKGWAIQKFFYKPYRFYRLLCAFLKFFAVKLPSKWLILCKTSNTTKQGNPISKSTLTVCFCVIDAINEFAVG
jgi:hypothetical protein